MFHVVFEPSGAEALQKSFELDAFLQGDVLVIRDDFAVGPLEKLETEEGWNARVDWWKEAIQFSPHTDQLGAFDDRETVRIIREKLEQDEQEQVWVWMGQNQHDVCGYFWLIAQLKNFQGRVFVLYLNNLPFINEKGLIFYPTHLAEISPREFLKARKLARPVTLSEFEIDPDEYQRLVQENGGVRILEGGKKIASKSIDFYDKDILSNLSTDWQKASRVIHNTLNRMKIKTGDVFLMRRLKQMIAEGRVEVNGNMEKGWKEFDVKLPGGAKEDEERI